MKVMRIRLAAACLLIVAIALASPGLASASQLIGRNASDLQLRANAKGEAMLSYTSNGKRVDVLAWGAINAISPAMGSNQTALRLDYSGGWSKYGRSLARSFVSTCGPYTGPSLAWFVTGCTMPDGSHWAVQSWQRGLPNLGFDPWKPLQSAWEIHLSHWNTELPKLEVWTNWAYSRHFEHIFGRVTYLGQPVFGFGSTAKGAPTDTFGRNVYLDTLNSQYGPGWRRENSFLAHKGSGVFCYGFYEHEPYPGYPAIGRRPQGKGERYRMTVIGPGLTPDVGWESQAIGPYDKALDDRLRDVQSQVYTNDRLCKPV